MVKSDSITFPAARLLIFLFLSLPFIAFTQVEAGEMSSDAATVPIVSEAEEDSSVVGDENVAADTVLGGVGEVAAPAEWGFGGILLRADYESVIALLESSDVFNYLHPTLSWPSPDSPVIDVEGNGRFVKKGYFQFHNKKLYSITLELNQFSLDYYTLFNRFKIKYGDYALLSPQQVKWQSPIYSLALEKPLTIKYLDLEVHQQFMDQSQAGKSQAELTRDQFLEQF